MEIGSFIDIDLRETGEYHDDGINLARLNSARAGIYHACRLYGCRSIYLPYYLCPSVKSFLVKHGIEVVFYSINEEFEPGEINQKADQAILLVNYFGILSFDRMMKLALNYRNVIVDNAAAFFNNSIEGCYNVYSPRKFFGVPDGCYVIGEKASDLIDKYEVDISSVTASFLLQRMELGASESYCDRMINEERIDNSSVLKMSILTRSLLRSIDYSSIKSKRKNNFQLAHNLFGDLNILDPNIFMDGESIPYIYPLIIEKPDLDVRLRDSKVYVGRLWNSVLKEVRFDSFEAKLSKFMVPIPIDQRYGEKELSFINEVVLAEKDG